jgi:dipeptidyl aminopeptidase/acylaminoacyl peptidase
VLHKGALHRPRLAAGDAPLGWPRFSPDGQWVLAATREAPETTLLLLGADGRLRRSLLTVEGTLLCWDWSPDGLRVVVVTQSEDAHVGDIRLIDVVSGAVRVLWTEAAYAYRDPVAAFAPGPNGGRLVFRSNRSGWSKLYTTAGDGSDARPLTTGAWDDESFCFSPDGEQIVFTSHAAQEGTGDDLWVASLAGGGPVRLTRQPGVHAPIGWSPTGRIVYWHGDPTEPGDVWAVAAAGKEPPRRITWSAPAELTRKLRAPGEVTFTGPDGTRVSALVYLPAFHEEGNRYPAIVWIRGGPTGFSRFAFAAQPSWLANEGFLVVTLNYRGSTGHGVEFMEAVAGEGVGKNDLQDVLAAADYAKTLPQADLSRGVGIGGHSWGGYLTLMAVTQAPEAFSCAVASAAIADWTVQQAQTEVRWYDRWLVGGWLYEREAHARERSPITHAERIRTPLLVLHGEQDKDVPFAQIGPFVERAKQSGAPVDYHTYPNEGHGNRLPGHQQDALDRMRVFFRRHLQPWDFRDNPVGDQVS